MKNLQICMGVLFIGFFGSSPTSAYLAGGDINLLLEIVRIDSGGRGESLCTAEMAVNPLAQGAWSLVIPSVNQKTGAQANFFNSAICNEDSKQVSVQKQATSTRTAVDLSQSITSPIELIGTIRIEAHLDRQMEDERLLLLDVEILEENITNTRAGNGFTSEKLLKRTLTFSDDAIYYLPFEFNGGAGSHEISAPLFYLRLESFETPTYRQEQHGVIYVHSEQFGASVLLDGSEVGQISSNGEFALPWIEPGFRKVSIRSKSVEEYVQFVKVKAARTALLRFDVKKRSEKQVNQIGLKVSGINVQGYVEYMRPIDQAKLILIPEGEILMGNERTERAPFEHFVYLSSFLIDKTAVTWGQYKQFIADTGNSLPLQKPYWGIHDDHPVVFVSWAEARSFCQWVGGRLPTEAEREKAARGTDKRLFPWGEQPPAPELGVFRSSWGNEATKPVGIRPLGASPYGVMDMGGNVWEWCSDWYSDEYLEMSPYENPAGPETGNLHVVRGGSWDSRPDVLSASCRNWGHPGYREGDFGFRCAMNVPPD